MQADPDPDIDQIQKVSIGIEQLNKKSGTDKSLEESIVVHSQVVPGGVVHNSKAILKNREIEQGQEVENEIKTSDAVVLGEDPDHR